MAFGATAQGSLSKTYLHPVEVMGDYGKYDGDQAPEDADAAQRPSAR